MPVTFLDEEENDTTQPSSVGRGVTFLDEEEPTKKSKVTFFDEYESDPVSEYNFSRSVSEKLAKSVNERTAQYDSLLQNPTATEDDKDNAFNKLKEVRVNFLREQENLKKLQPAVNAIFQQREQDELAYINNFSKDPLTAKIVQPLLDARESREAQLAELSQGNLTNEEYQTEAQKISEGFSKYLKDTVTQVQKGAEEDRLLLRDLLNEKNRARNTGLGRVGVAEAIGSTLVGTGETQKIADLAADMGDEYVSNILNREFTLKDKARGVASRITGAGVLGIPFAALGVGYDALYYLTTQGDTESDRIAEMQDLQERSEAGDQQATQQLETMKREVQREALESAVEKLPIEEKLKIQRDYVAAKQDQILANVEPERRQAIIEATDKIMDSYEASRFDTESPKAYGARLPDGTLHLTPRGKSDINLAIDKLAEAGEITEESKENYKNFYTGLEAARERAVRGAAVETQTFQNWIKNNPEYSIETDKDVQEALDAFEESHNTWAANAIDLIVGPFRGIASYVTGGTVGARLSAIAASDASDEEKTDQMLKIYAEENEQLAERGPTSTLGGAAEITGNFAAQALPMLTAKILSLFGPTRAIGQAAIPTARAYTMAHMGVLYAGQGYMEAVGQAVKESGYDSLEEIQEKNPELAERINETGKRAMIDAAKISLTEQIPIEGLVSSLGKFAKKPTLFKRIMEAVALNPAAEITQEIFADTAMQAAQSRYSMENKDIQMMSLGEIGQMYLGVLPITGGTAVAARRIDREMARREEAIAKLDERQRRIVEAESALIDAAERASQEAAAIAPETAAALAEQATTSRQAQNTKIEQVGGAGISITPTVSPRREGETEQQWAARIERERTGTTLPESRTIAESVRDKDTFSYQGMRGALSVEDGEVVFREFGTQEKYIVPAAENQPVSEVEGVEWLRRGQRKQITPEPVVEVSQVVESAPVVTQDEVDTAESDFEPPAALVEIEKSETLNFLADLFDTGESKVSQEGKRAQKVSQTPEFYRQVKPEQIDRARKLIDNALRIIDAADLDDASKDALADPFLRLDQDIDKYEQNREYKKYKTSLRREVQPTGEAVEIAPTVSEAEAAERELEQRARAEAERLEREARGRRVAAGQAAFIPPAPTEALGRINRGEAEPNEFESLVEQGYAEEYKGQQVLTQAGIDLLPETERPRLTPEARKIQIDTRTGDAAAEAIAKGLRIGVDQVPPDARMPEGWTLEGDVYIPPTAKVAPATEPQPAEVASAVEPAVTEVAPQPIANGRPAEELTADEWLKFHFNEDRDRYLPEDYFKDSEFKKTKEEVPTAIQTLENGIELRRDRYGSIYAFDGERNVGYADGKAFIVDPEYQRRGIGSSMLDIFLSENPNKPIGSMTPAGFNLLRSAHRRAVERAIQEGRRPPENVVAYYPELAAPAPVTPTPTEPQPREVAPRRAMPSGVEVGERKPELPALTIFDRLMAFANEYVSRNPDNEQIVSKKAAEMTSSINSMTTGRSDAFRDELIDRVEKRFTESLKKAESGDMDVKKISTKRLVLSAFSDVKNLKRFRGEIAGLEDSLNEDDADDVSLGSKVADESLPPDVKLQRKETEDILQNFTPLERAAVSGELIKEKLIDIEAAYEYIEDAKNAGFSNAQIRKATKAALAKWRKETGDTGLDKRVGVRKPETGQARYNRLKSHVSNIATPEYGATEGQRVESLEEVRNELFNRYSKQLSDAGIIVQYVSKYQTGDDAGYVASSVANTGDGRVVLTFGNLEMRILAQTQSNGEAAKVGVAQSVEEEIIHAVHVQHMLKTWDGKTDINEHLYGSARESFADIMGRVGQEPFVNAFGPMLRAYYNRENFSNEEIISFLLENPASTYQGYTEIVRQLVELQTQGRIGEAAVAKFLNTVSEFLQSVVDAIAGFVGLEGYRGSELSKDVDAVSRGFRAVIGDVQARESRRAITPQQDRDYLDAVERGDLDAASNAIYNAAESSFGSAPIKVYRADSEAYSRIRPTENAIGIFSTRKKYIADEFSEATGVVREFYIPSSNALNLTSRTSLSWLDDARIEFNESDLLEGALWKKPVWLEIQQEAKRQGYDVLIIPDQTASGETFESYIVLNPEKMKLADAITRDDDGNIIPLSQRFQPSEADIRYSKIISSGENKVYSPIVVSDQDTGAYHYGDGGIAGDTVLRRMDGRGTGHMGTGVYFLGKKEAGFGREGRPLINIDLSGLNMANPETLATELHNRLRIFNEAIRKKEKLKFGEPRFDGRRILSLIDIAIGRQISGDKEKRIRSAMLNVEKIFRNGQNDGIRTPSTYLMQELGFDGIDVRGTEADGTTIGSVVFAKPVPKEAKEVAGMTTDAVKARLEALGFGVEGMIRIVEDPQAAFEGRTIIQDGKAVRIELNASALNDDAAIDRVLNHEFAEAANADGALNKLVERLTPKEKKEINDAITRLGYEERVRTTEEAARAIETLAAGWKGRGFFERAVARVEAWGSKLGLKLTRRAAEYIAARNLSDINAGFKAVYNRFINVKGEAREGRAFVTPEENARFMELAKDPEANREELQKMVDDAAEKAGFSVFDWWHGTKKDFNTFKATRYDDGLIFFSSKRDFSEQWAKNRKPNEKILERIESVKKEARKLVDGLFAADPRFDIKKPWSENTPEMNEAANKYLEAGKEFERSKLDGMTWIEAEREMGTRIIRAYLSAERIFDPSKDWREVLPAILKRLGIKSEAEIEKQSMDMLLKGNYLIWEDKNLTDAVFEKFDAMMIQEDSDGPMNTIAVRDPSLIKMADPVTYDDQGNVIPLDQRFQPATADIRYSRTEIRESRREQGQQIPPTPDETESTTQEEVSSILQQREQAKIAQNELVGHSVLDDEIPEEYNELTEEDYENGMSFDEFKFSRAYNFNSPAYKEYIAPQWLRLNGGLMPTVKVEGLELSKPEKGTAEADALRLLKRAVSIYDSRSDVRGGKELTYSLGEIMATWMESGLGTPALRNAIVQYTNLDVDVAERAANNFAEVYKLSQDVADAKDRAQIRIERGLPAETARQKAEKRRRMKLEQAAGTIDAIAESIRIAFDVNVKKPRTDRATERKQIEEQLRQAKRILKEVVPPQYLAKELSALEAATGLDGLRNVVEAAQDALGRAMLDNATARAKKAFNRATAAVKKNEIGPDAAAALREFVDTYRIKGLSEDTRKKIQEAVAAFDANPIEALEDAAKEKYRKRGGELEQIKIDQTLGLDALNDIADYVNTILHADKIARGEMLFNKTQTRTEIIDKSLEEIGKAKRIDNSILLSVFRIAKGMRGEAILNALGLETLRKNLYENLVTGAYSDELANTHRLKKIVETGIKDITGFDIGSKDFDRYSKELIEVRGTNLSGESGTIKIQRNELWDILGSLRDPDNMRRAVQSGGYVLNRLRAENLDTVKITPDNYIDLSSKATDKDNALISFFHGLYNNEFFEMLNDSYIQAYGHGFKKVDSYYPRNADWITRRTDPQDDLAYNAYVQSRVDDFGPMKERDPRARARLVASDALTRLDYHLTNDSRIAAYLPISKDIDSILNDPKIKEGLTKKIGQKGYRQIVDMTRQQMVPAKGLPDNILSTLTKNVGVGVLGLKIHAAMQNPVGIPIATASYGMDGFKYLAKAIPFGLSAVDPAKWRKMAKVLGDYAPYYNERYGLGGYAKEMTSGVLDTDYRDTKFRRSAEHAALFMLEKTDQWGAYVRYRIAQERIKDTTNLEVGSEAFNREVAKEWSLIMFRSENTSHGADRTGVFQFAAKHPFAKLFIMFQSAVSKQFSLAAEGVLQIQQGGAKNRREGLAKLGLFFTSVYMSAAISRAFYGFLFPPKDEEEEKKTWLEFLSGIIAAPASSIPVVGNFVSTSIENFAATASGKPDFGIRRPMQVDLVSSFLFGSYDMAMAVGKFVADLSDQEINEITGDPKYRDSFFRLAQKATGPISMATGVPLGGISQIWKLAVEKPRELFFAGDEAKRKETTKKILDAQKAERPEPVNQEMAKIYFAAMENNPKQFSRAVRELKEKRPDASLRDVQDSIRRRQEFLIARLVARGDISVKNGDITREEYLENKALLNSTLSVVREMWATDRLNKAK